MAGALGPVTEGTGDNGKQTYSLTLELDKANSPVSQFERLAIGDLTIGGSGPPGVLRLVGSELRHCGRSCRGALPFSWHQQFFRTGATSSLKLLPDEMEAFAYRQLIDERESYYEPAVGAHRALSAQTD